MNEVVSLAVLGGSGLRVDVECHMAHGLPTIIIVGSASQAVIEARERVRSAFASSRIQLPRRRITLNLAPADISKDSTCFDLAMAASILLNEGHERTEQLLTTPVLGELGLDGTVRPVRGIIGALLAGRQLGYSCFIIPAANLSQACLVPDISLIAVSNLSELHAHLNGSRRLTKVKSGQASIRSHVIPSEVDFQDIAGQQRAKRALEVAAAGGHNILLSGPPGSGKSMLARAVSSILPPLSAEEILEVTQLHSLRNHDYQQIITSRPFRAPHHSASLLSLIGGGAHPKPGEVSLSHRGILFLDEFPEFSRQTIEALRQPLEDRIITVSRTKDNLSFPAQFMLVATANPCPCGKFGTSQICNCPPYRVLQYQQKLSGPVLDRIDLYIQVDQVSHTSLLKQPTSDSSAAIQQRVMKARQRQQKRYKNRLKTNAWLTNREVKQHCALSTQSMALLNQAATQLNMSARSYMRTLKLARSIADLEDCPQIDLPHLTEALQYRRTS